jgi:hypothetical protein
VKGRREWTKWPKPPGPFFAVLIVLLALKLTGVIGWSWWLVLLPLWCPVAIALPFVLVFLMFAGTDQFNEWMVRWRIRRRHAGDNPELWL